MMCLNQNYNLNCLMSCFLFLFEERDLFRKTNIGRYCVPTTMLYCVNTCILFFPIPHATFQCLTINITIYCAFGNRYWVYIGWVSEMHVAQLLLCILVRLTDGQRAKMKFITNHLFTLKNGFSGLRSMCARAQRTPFRQMSISQCYFC